jgi:hypothetical protein
MVNSEVLCPIDLITAESLVASLPIGEGLEVQLIQNLELGDFHVLELLAITLELEFGGLPDSAEVFVFGGGRDMAEPPKHEVSTILTK